MSNTIPMSVATARRPHDPFARAWAAPPAVPMPAPASTTATGLLSSLRRMLGDLLAGWRAQRRRIATQRALLGLDDRTLRDIGIVRAEVESLAAEAHGGVAATRARMLKHVPQLH